MFIFGSQWFLNWFSFFLCLFLFYIGIFYLLFFSLSFPISCECISGCLFIFSTSIYSNGTRWFISYYAFVVVVIAHITMHRKSALTIWVVSQNEQWTNMNRQVVREMRIYPIILVQINQRIASLFVSIACLI